MLFKVHVVDTNKLILKLMNKIILEATTERVPIIPSPELTINSCLYKKMGKWVIKIR